MEATVIMRLLCHETKNTSHAGYQDCEVVGHILNKIRPSAFRSDKCSR